MRKSLNVQVQMRSQKMFRCILARHREAAEQLQSQYIKILENKGEKLDGHQGNDRKVQTICPRLFPLRLWLHVWQDLYMDMKRRFTR